MTLRTLQWRQRDCRCDSPAPALYISYNYPSTLFAHPANRFRALFEQMDLDCDGFISVNEYTAALQSAGAIDAAEEAGRKVISKYDTSHDGRLNYDEFKVLATEMLTRRDSSDILKIGFLFKQGRGEHWCLAKPWARRTFVLTKQGLLNYYFTNKQTQGEIMKEKRGDFDVKNCMVTYMNRTLDRRGITHYIFSVSNAKNVHDGDMDTLYLAAPSKTLAREWVTVIGEFSAQRVKAPPKSWSDAHLSRSTTWYQGAALRSWMNSFSGDRDCDVGARCRKITHHLAFQVVMDLIILIDIVVAIIEVTLTAQLDDDEHEPEGDEWTFFW